jgi:hypothetical protein
MMIGGLSAREWLRDRTPPLLWSGAKWLWRRFQQLIRATAETAGFTVALRSDYYSPLPRVAELRKTLPRWHRPSAMRGVTIDVESYERKLLHLLKQFGDELSSLPPYRSVQRRGFGVGFNEFDAWILYLMIRDLRPRRYIEVGSGVSTFYAHMAGVASCDETGQPLRICCIEPNASRRLRRLPGVELLKRPVQDVDLELFDELGEGDVLFIDSSHIVRIDGDVPFLYLEVLPRLPAGVVVHVHDVPFPYNVPHPPEMWVFGDREAAPFWPVFWNEAMLLQALLCGNAQFSIDFSAPLIRHFDPEFLATHVSFYRSIDEDPNTFSSIWLRKHV